MARVTADQLVEKWARRLKSSTEDIRQGALRVTKAPSEGAIAAQDRMLAKLTAAIMDGTWAASLRRVTLEQWRDALTKVGIGRIAAGVDNAMPEMQDMASRLLSALDAVKAEVERTPRGDLEANITRATTQIRGMAARKLRRPGGR